MMRVLFILLLFNLITSCEKECGDNCAEISITGQVVNALNKQGIADIPIRVNWQESGFGFFSTTLKLAKTKTNRQGKFKVSKIIDKTKFDSYYLKVEADIPDGFIDNYGQNENLIHSISQYQRDNDLRMEIYPAVKLAIKLVKNQNDNFNYFDLNYSYHQPYSAGVFRSDNNLNDTTFNVKTAPNVYTRITWRKSYGFGQTPTFVDSIICSTAKENIFIINY